MTERAPPAAEETPRTLDRRALTLWRIYGTAQALAGTVIGAALGVPLLTRGAIGWLGWGLGVVLLAVLLGLALVVIVPRLRWRRWRYALDTHEIFLQHGIFVLRRTLVPVVRVQNVDTVQGPLSRHLGLSSVTVSTAARTHEIPALRDGEADRLRDLISRLAREARDEP